MHGVLAFVAGVCTTIGVLLIILALAGITYYGLAPQAQLAVALVVILIAAIAVWILYYGLKAREYKIETGKEALIGSIGKTVTDLNPNGTVRVLGEFWQATTKAESVKSGQTVKVVGMEGMFLVVQAVEEKA
jgi:membrane-bound serine protease (ClpP class)